MSIVLRKDSVEPLSNLVFISPAIGSKRSARQFEIPAFIPGPLSLLTFTFPGPLWSLCNIFIQAGLAEWVMRLLLCLSVCPCASPTLKIFTYMLQAAFRVLSIDLSSFSSIILSSFTWASPASKKSSCDITVNLPLLSVSTTISSPSFVLLLRDLRPSISSIVRVQSLLETSLYSLATCSILSLLICIIVSFWIPAGLGRKMCVFRM